MFCSGYSDIWNLYSIVNQLYFYKLKNMVTVKYNKNLWWNNIGKNISLKKNKVPYVKKI